MRAGSSVGGGAFTQLHLPSSQNAYLPLVPRKGLPFGEGVRWSSNGDSVRLPRKVAIPDACANHNQRGQVRAHKSPTDTADVHMKEQRHGVHGVLDDGSIGIEDADNECL